MRGRFLSTFIFICTITGCLQPSAAVAVDRASYMHVFASAAKTPWPKNRQLNIVFHGHSVPAGFFKTPEVRTLEAYPFLTLVGLKARYPLAQINTVVSARGGETSVQGAKRFASGVLTHRPDVVVIDYVLNDRDLTVAQANQAWRSMISQAKAAGATVILVTASPDLSASPDARRRIARHSQQVRGLARNMEVGLVDAEHAFAKIAPAHLPKYMAQANHPNGIGHALIAKELLAWFH